MIKRSIAKNVAKILLLGLWILAVESILITDGKLQLLLNKTQSYIPGKTFMLFSPQQWTCYVKDEDSTYYKGFVWKIKYIKQPWTDLKRDIYYDGKYFSVGRLQFNSTSRVRYQHMDVRSLQLEMYGAVLKCETRQTPLKEETRIISFNYRKRTKDRILRRSLQKNKPLIFSFRSYKEQTNKLKLQNSHQADKQSPAKWIVIAVIGVVIATPVCLVCGNKSKPKKCPPPHHEQYEDDYYLYDDDEYYDNLSGSSETTMSSSASEADTLSARKAKKKKKSKKKSKKEKKKKSQAPKPPPKVNPLAKAESQARIEKFITELDKRIPQIDRSRLKAYDKNANEEGIRGRKKKKKKAQKVKRAPAKEGEK